MGTACTRAEERIGTITYRKSVEDVWPEAEIKCAKAQCRETPRKVSLGDLPEQQRPNGQSCP